MDSRSFILIVYSVLSFLMIIFSRQISDFNYKLVLYFTNKLKLKDLFLFKINHENKDSMRVLMRSFTLIFALFIFGLSIHYLLQ